MPAGPFSPEGPAGKCGFLLLMLLPLCDLCELCGFLLLMLLPLCDLCELCGFLLFLFFLFASFAAILFLLGGGKSENAGLGGVEKTMSRLGRGLRKTMVVPTGSRPFPAGPSRSVLARSGPFGTISDTLGNWLPARAAGGAGLWRGLLLAGVAPKDIDEVILHKDRTERFVGPWI